MQRENLSLWTVTHKYKRAQKCSRISEKSP